MVKVKARRMGPLGRKLLTTVFFQTTSYETAGSLERRILPGEDIELHFASKNPEEENGAVVVSYQSNIPAFKGDDISHPLGLKSTSAIRLLCHMLREPLFDDLRTKQQLGYVVSAYYEMGQSSRPGDQQAALGPLTCPVDFITICILSRKLPPPDITRRIDEFLEVFRESLASMPESEIRDHAEALSTKLLKPIQKLQSEANNHFTTIQRYGPEVFYKNNALGGGGGGGGEVKNPDLPWRSVETLARSIQTLERKDLLESWDRMMDPSDRCRVVSCVYGNTFPLAANEKGLAAAAGNNHNKMVVNNKFGDLLQWRKNMAIYDDQATQARKRSIFRLPGPPQSRMWTMVGVGVLGVGVVGLSMAARNQSTRTRSTNR
jgi:hypothetical protein